MLKRKSAQIFLILMSASSCLLALTCPSVEHIERQAGTYEWRTSDPGWVGRFVVPLNGKGHAYKVLRFVQAQWIQLKDLPDAPGVLQCDYIGDFEQEVIRFTQANAQITYRPHNIEWSCEHPTQFPQVACGCSVSVVACSAPESPVVPTSQSSGL